MIVLHAAVALGCSDRAVAPCMATVVSFRDSMRLGVTRMQLAPHLVRPAVAPGEKTLNSPPQGMLRSLHGNPLPQAQSPAWLWIVAGLGLSLSAALRLSHPPDAQCTSSQALMKVGPADDDTQSRQLSSHPPHLNTSTCDCAPPETIESLQMQVPSAKRSHLPALTRSCSLQPCSASTGPASGVAHHLHRSPQRLGAGADKALCHGLRSFAGLLHVPCMARAYPECRRDAVRNWCWVLPAFNLHNARSWTRWGSITSHLCSNVDNIAGVVAQRSLVALQVGDRVRKLQLKREFSCCAGAVL